LPNEVSKQDKMDLKSFLAPELLAEYMTYNIKQQLYTKFRGVGLAMEVAWEKAGFPKKNARQNASSFEKNHPLIKDIIKTLQTRAKLNGLGKENSVISKEIANNALQGRTVLDIIASKKGEEANQLQFYADVISGNIKQHKKTTTTDKETGKEVVKVEEIEPSISERLKAREKLDSLLGIDDVSKVIGEVEVNKDITIKIVDTTAPKELVDDSPIIDAETIEETEVDSESDDDE
jgi:hypothetical protein